MYRIIYVYLEYLLFLFCLFAVNFLFSSISSVFIVAIVILVAKSSSSLLLLLFQMDVLFPFRLWWKRRFFTIFDFPHSVGMRISNDKTWFSAQTFSFRYRVCSQMKHPFLYLNIYTKGAVKKYLNEKKSSQIMLKGKGKWFKRQNFWGKEDFRKFHFYRLLQKIWWSFRKLVSEGKFALLNDLANRFLVQTFQLSHIISQNWAPSTS